MPAGLPELESDKVKPFTLEARDAVDPTQATVAAGVIKLNVVNRSVLPVGHTFVKGVDLLDGHLVQQSTDFKAARPPPGPRGDPHLLERRLEQPGAARAAAGRSTTPRASSSTAAAASPPWSPPTAAARSSSRATAS